MSPRSNAGCRLDANHAAVVEALQRIPLCFVQTLAPVGAGCPDLLVWYRGRWIVAEIKDGDKPPSARALTDAEKAWHARAKACGAAVEIWESAEQAVVSVLQEAAQ